MGHRKAAQIGLYGTFKGKTAHRAAEGFSTLVVVSHHTKKASLRKHRTGR